MASKKKIVVGLGLEVCILRDFYRPALARLFSLETTRSTVLRSRCGLPGAGDRPRLGPVSATGRDSTTGGPRSRELRHVTIGRHVAVNI